jgi:Na+/H+ antiporter NhaA
MTRQHTTPRHLVRRLRPAPERFAAAAALQNPGLLLQLQASDEHAEEEPSGPSPVSGETGAALLLVAAVALALLWSNSPWEASYAAFWHAPVALTVGPWKLGADLRTWIDGGLMTLFFLVVGLEAKRERDLGELREGRRLTVPVLAALAGMASSAAVYVALTAGGGVDRHLLALAATSPITWGIILAYVVGKPLGIVIASCAAAKRRAVLSLSWSELRGTALSAAIGFTVSLLIASRAFDGALLDQAKVGILATALLAPALAVAALAPLRRRESGAPLRRGYRLAATSLCPAR